MINQKISEDVQCLLKEYFKTTPLIVIRYTCQALLMRNNGMKFADSGDIVSRNRITVSGWLTHWERRRMARIFTGHKDNENANKLSKEQQKELQEILKKPPSEYALPKEFWDVPLLKKYGKATFNSIYESISSYHVLLKFSDLSFKYPDTFDLKRNDPAIKKRMTEIANEISPLLTNPE